MGKVKAALNYIKGVRGSSWLILSAIAALPKGGDATVALCAMAIVCYAVERVEFKLDRLQQEKDN